MKTLIAILVITISSAMAAPKKWPELAYSHVVAYCYDFSQDARGSSISFPDGSLHKGIIKATTVRLSDEQASKLLKLLTEDAKYERGDVDCYEPHHGFVFYDASWRIVASIDICFLCENYTTRPKGASELVDLRAIETLCRQIDLPCFDNSKEYTKLFRQEQPMVNAAGKEGQKQNDSGSGDPFETAE